MIRVEQLRVRAGVEKVKPPRKRKRVKITRTTKGSRPSGTMRRGKSKESLEARALEMHIKGHTYYEIGVKLKVSDVYAFNLTKAALARWNAQLGLDVEQWRNKQLMQLAAIYKAHEKLAKKSVKSAEFCLKALQHEAKLTGTEKPTQVVLTPKLELEYDTSKLSVDQLKQLRELALLMEVKDAQPAAVPMLEHKPEGDVIEGEVVNASADEVSSVS